MHPLTYEVKRAHWRTTWEAIRLYRAAGKSWGEPTLAKMTPARCDVLQWIWDWHAEWHERRRGRGLPPEPRSLPLADLRTLLGLAGATVWKCVRRLAEMEWVKLVPHPERKRQILIVLEDLGVHALRMAQRCASAETIDDPERGPRRGFYRCINDFVRWDAVEQGALTEEGNAVATASGPRLEDMLPFITRAEDADGAATPRPEEPTAAPSTQEGDVAAWRPRRYRPMECWSHYFWWLVRHAHALAWFFGSEAWTLYHRAAYGQVVQEDD